MSRQILGELLSSIPVTPNKDIKVGAELDKENIRSFSNLPKSEKRNKLQDGASILKKALGNKLKERVENKVSVQSSSNAVDEVKYRLLQSKVIHLEQQLKNSHGEIHLLRFSLVKTQNKIRSTIIENSGCFVLHVSRLNRVLQELSNNLNKNDLHSVEEKTQSSKLNASDEMFSMSAEVNTTVYSSPSISINHSVKLGNDNHAIGGTPSSFLKSPPVRLTPYCELPEHEVDVILPIDYERDDAYTVPVDEVGIREVSLNTYSGETVEHEMPEFNCNEKSLPLPITPTDDTLKMTARAILKRLSTPAVQWRANAATATTADPTPKTLRSAWKTWAVIAAAERDKLSSEIELNRSKLELLSAQNSPCEFDIMAQYSKKEVKKASVVEKKNISVYSDEVCEKIAFKTSKGEALPILSPATFKDILKKIHEENVELQKDVTSVKSRITAFKSNN